MFMPCTGIANDINQFTVQLPERVLFCIDCGYVVLKEQNAIDPIFFVCLPIAMSLKTIFTIYVFTLGILLFIEPFTICLV